MNGSEAPRYMQASFESGIIIQPLSQSVATIGMYNDTVFYS